MGIHVETRPSGRPHTPHAAHNHLQEPLLAYPVEAVVTVRRATLGEHGHELDTSGLAEAATGRRRSGFGSFPGGATSARARPSSLALLQVGCRARFLSGEGRLLGGVVRGASERPPARNGLWRAGGCSPAGAGCWAVS